MEVPPAEREEKLDDELAQVRELFAKYEGNLALVHEHMEGAGVGYSTLTAFCRRHGIGVVPKERAGRYHFEPGEEMQHDTSPHKVTVAGKVRLVQCASLVLCYSRMVFAQVYPTYDRFQTKVFLTDALLSFGGSAGRCMLDNSSVVVAHGTGKSAVMAPEIEAFAKRFGFTFAAHEVGDANRSARVERPFHYIEHNFYPGRPFADMDDLNRQLAEWCDKVNRKYRRHIKAVPVELYNAERPSLKPLPIHVPEVYRVFHRMVDVEGYVSLHTNRYSASERLIGRQVLVRETKEHVRVYAGHELDCEHVRRAVREEARCTLPQHTKRWASTRKETEAPEEKALRVAGPELGQLVDRLKKHHGGRAVRPLRVLHRMYVDYPLETLVAAVAEALRYGLIDLERIERMVLKNVRGNYFQLSMELADEKEAEGTDREAVPIWGEERDA